MEVQQFLLSKRNVLNALVRARVYPGFPVDEAASAALSWMEALSAANLELETWPWEVALDMAEKGLLTRPVAMVPTVADWIKRFPKAVREGRRDALVDFVHALVSLSGYPEYLEKIIAWLGTGLGEDWGQMEFRNALTVFLWLAGGAPWRRAALEAFSRLKTVDREVIVATAAPQWSERDILSLGSDGLGSEPWSRWCGGVMGFGGAWLSPPRAAAWEGRLFVWNADRVWEIFADAFGVALVPGGADPDAVGTMSMDLGPQRWIHKGDKLTGPSGVSYPFPWGAPPDNLKGAELNNGLAVVSSQDLFSVLVLYRGVP